MPLPVDELLHQAGLAADEVMAGVIRALPPAWQYPAICRARMMVGGATIEGPDFRASPWAHARADPRRRATQTASLEVVYTEETAKADEGPFLKEERKLLDAIAERLGRYLEHAQAAAGVRGRSRRRARAEHDRPRAVAGDPRLPAPHRRDAARPHLAQDDQPPRLARRRRRGRAAARDERRGDPRGRATSARTTSRSSRVGRDPAQERVEETFHIAAERPERRRDHRPACRSGSARTSPASCVTTLGNPGRRRSTRSPRRSAATTTSGPAASSCPLAAHKGVRVSLIERFFTDQLEFINTAKRHLDIDDFYELVQHIVSPPRTRGKLGGKSAGLFLASRILARAGAGQPGLRDIQMPRTWYVTSDGIVGLHPVQQPRGRLQPQVRGHRAGPPGLPAHRAGLQELRVLARDGARPLAGARRLRRPADHRAQLEPARGPPRLGVLRASTRASSSPTRAPSSSGWPRCSTRSPRSTRRRSGPIRSSTAPSAA